MSKGRKTEVGLDDAFEKAVLGAGSVRLRAGLALGLWYLLDSMKPEKERVPRGLRKFTELLVAEIGRQAEAAHDVHVPDDELTAAAALRVLARHHLTKKPNAGRSKR